MTFGNEVYKIDFELESKEKIPLFGAKYHFYLEGVVNCPEFLVYFPLLEKYVEIWNLILVLKTLTWERIDSTEVEIDSTEAEIDGTEVEIGGTEPEIDGTEAEIDGTESEIDGTEAEIDGTEAEIDGTEAEIDGTEAEIDGTEAEIDGTEAEIDGTEAEIDGTEAEIDGTEAGDSTTVEEISRFQCLSLIQTGWCGRASCHQKLTPPVPMIEINLNDVDLSR